MVLIPTTSTPQGFPLSSPIPYLYTSYSKVRALAPNTFSQSYLLHTIVLELLHCITAKQLEKRIQGLFEIALFPLLD